MKKRCYTKNNGPGSTSFPEEIYHELVKERLKEKIKIENECWIWQGCLSRIGYGQTSYRSKPCMAHRVSWIVFKGKISKNENICHHCDERRCINPEHLFSGTQSENVIDAFNKKRKSHQGENHPRVKLSETDIYKILEMRREGMTQREIGEFFGVTQVTISAILRGKNWSHLNLNR